MIPTGIVTTAWPRVVAQCRAMGVEFDDWQQGAGAIALGKRANGKYAATVGGVVMSIPRQVGKALDVKTPMLTANRGWTTMGGLRAGDFVFGADGSPTEVLAAHPVRQDRECFLVTTTDGRQVVADAEHLWTVTDMKLERSAGKSRWHDKRTLTTRGLLDYGLRRTERANGRNEWRFQLPRQGVVVGATADLPIDPYVLGAWLGDGTTVNGTFAVHADDRAHLVEQIEAGGYTARSAQGRTAWIVRASAAKGHRAQRDSLAGHLRSLGVLGNKHIPDAYLASDVRQREALLQGLMDTDGSIATSGRCEFTSTRYELAEAVLFLVRSLGWRATIKQSDAKLSGRVVSQRWRVVFTPKTYDPVKPFRLPRKAERIVGTPDTHGRHTVSISSIEPVASRPVRCITVAAVDALYLAGRDLIVTHNTFLVGMIIIALCILHPGLTVVWSAHRTRTTTKTFQSLKAMTQRKKIAPFMEDPRNTNGEQEIRFKNGSAIMFGAREAGFGRGFDEVDVAVFDEAQILGEKALEDIIPAMNQSRQAAGALPFFMGTPPRPSDPGEEFSTRRSNALKGDSDMAYIEFSADADADPDDWSQVAKANPSFPLRTPRESILRMRKQLTNVDSFRREGLGIWESEGMAALDWMAWSKLADPDASRGPRPTFGVAVAPDRSWAAVAAAWRRPDGLLQVALTAEGYRPTAIWVTDHVAQLRKRAPGSKVFVDQAARGLIERVEEPTQQEQAQADNALADAVLAGTIRQGNDDELNTAVKASRWRKSVDTRVLDRKGKTDISPLRAVALAMWGARNATSVYDERGVRTIG